MSEDNDDDVKEILLPQSLYKEITKTITKLPLWTQEIEFILEAIRLKLLEMRMIEAKRPTV